MNNKKAPEGATIQLKYTLRDENIPEDLKIIPQWVCWDAVYLEEKDKFTKVPINPMTGNKASSTDPSTWGTFSEALNGMQKYSMDGIGIVLTKGLGLVGVDIDNCYIDGMFSDEAIIAIQAFGSYTEFSPSGKGIRIFVYGSLPEGRRRKGNFEIYNCGRFLTITGNKTSIYNKVESRQASINYIHSKYLSDEVKIINPVRREFSIPDNDSELIQKIVNSKNGYKFQSLYRGDRAGYSSASDADIALCNILAYWCNGDYSRIDSLFRSSGLYRDKWDEKRGARTYGQITIEKSISDTGGSVK